MNYEEAMQDLIPEGMSIDELTAADMTLLVAMKIVTPDSPDYWVLARIENHVATVLNCKLNDMIEALK